MTQSDLQQLFAPFGATENVSVVTDRDTGRSRGFGFVEMPNDTEAAAAIAALNGKDSEGRPLTVNEARSKTDRGGSSRGSRGGHIHGSHRRHVNRENYHHDLFWI